MLLIDRYSYYLLNPRLFTLVWPSDSCRISTLKPLKPLKPSSVSASIPRFKPVISRYHLSTDIPGCFRIYIRGSDSSFSKTFQSRLLIPRVKLKSQILQQRALCYLIKAHISKWPVLLKPVMERIMSAFTKSTAMRRPASRLSVK